MIAMNTAKYNTFRCQNKNKSIKAAKLPWVHWKDKLRSNKNKAVLASKIEK